MTVIIVLSDCPPRLRGDMTKWFVEINTGVYVGNINARVRDEVWRRVTENIGHGHATMVFGAPGEQHMDFRVHNAYWRPVDFDGIKLMLRPNVFDDGETDHLLKPGFSNASKHRIISKRKLNPSVSARFSSIIYVVLDFETTGVDAEQDEIIEIGAMVVECGKVKEKIEMLVKCDNPIPNPITELTGITDDDLNRDGISLSDAIEKLKDFAEDIPFLCHNASFERDFLSSACEKIGEDEFENRFIDTLEMARLVLPEQNDYKLTALAEYLEVPLLPAHRALNDCEMTYGIYVKLNEIASD